MLVTRNSFNHIRQVSAKAQWREWRIGIWGAQILKIMAILVGMGMWGRAWSQTKSSWAWSVSNCIISSVRFWFMSTRCTVVHWCFFVVSSWLPMFCSCSRTSSIILFDAPPYIKPHDKFFSMTGAKKKFVSPSECVCFLLSDNESNETHHTEVLLLPCRSQRFHKNPADE